MAIPASRKKRQSRLNFTPAPSSSPARPEAFVRIDDGSSPSKKRRIGQVTPLKTSSESMFSSPTSSRLQKVEIPRISKKFHLPTPVQSSQRDLDSDEESEDEIVTRRSGRRSLRTAQGPQSDPASDDIPHSTEQSSSRGAIYLSSETEVGEGKSDSDSAPNPEKSIIPQGVSPTLVVNGSLRGGARKGTWKKTPVKRRGPTWEIVSDSDSDINPKVTSSSSSRRTKQLNSPRRRLRSQRERDDRSVSREPRSPTSSRKTKKAELDWDESGTERSDEQFGANGIDRPNEGLTSVESTSGSESDSDVLPTPSRIRKAQQNVSEVSKGKKRAGESDLEEELADLDDSEIEIQKKRTRGGPQATQRNIRRNKLQELRASRLRGGDAPSTDEGSSTTSDEAVEEPFEIEDEVHERRRNTSHGENPDEYESDFVDDDGEDDNINVDLARGGVPLELTSFGRLKPFEYFKHEVEWMIHNKLNPAFNRYDEVYELSHKKLDDEFRGQAGSKFKSSVWKQDFIQALEGRPDCHILKIPAMMDEKCAACNRSGHPPTFKVTLSGRKYDKKSLDPIMNDDESDSDIESTNEDDEAEEENFFVGRHCCQNAEIAHALYHWRYQLNDFILNWLADEGHLTPQKIVERERWANKKRGRLANRIHDDMVERRQMNELYRQFRGSLDAARDFKPERYVPRH